MASARPRDLPKTLKSLRDERNTFRTKTAASTSTTFSRLDLITQELNTLRCSVEPNLPKQIKSDKGALTQRRVKAANVGSASTLLEKAAAISSALEGRSSRLSLNLCETPDLVSARQHSKQLNETITSVYSTAKTKRTLLRTPSALKSTSSSSTPRTPCSPVKAKFGACSFVHGMSSLHRDPLIDQAAELLSSLKSQGSLTSRNSSDIKAVPKQIAGKTANSGYSRLLKSSRLPKPQGQVKKTLKS